MPKNVEIKARIKDFNEFIDRAKSLCKTEPVKICQEDTFFTTPKGRLKLRQFKDGSKSELIFYIRPNTESAKISDYSIAVIDNNCDLSEVLKLALGIIGSVKKTRYFFLYEQTRIHVDRVENLGDFLELEVVLLPKQSAEEGKEIAEFLMNKLDIVKENLIKEAYIDLLLKQ